MDSKWDNMRQWMNDYMKSFYSQDAKIQQGILLKEAHTWRVVDICKNLADYFRLSYYDNCLLQMAGMLHDIGRFSQFQKFHTFNDALSVNHAAESIAVLKKQNILAGLAQRDQDMLIFAIYNHNKKEIESNPSARDVFFTKALRDADKLDIYYVLEPYLQPTDGQGFAPYFLEQFMDGNQCDYAQICTADDKKLVRLMWAYDVNYSWTMKKIIEKKYLDKIIGLLPNDDKIQKGVFRLQQYIRQKCAQQDKIEF